MRRDTLNHPECVAWVALCATLVLTVVASSGRASDELPQRATLLSDPVILLREALSRRYDCDLAARIRITVRGRHGGVQTRVLETVTKRFDGRKHSIGRVLAPEHLRGMTVMTIEAEDRADDTFIYLPSLRRSRRIVMNSRGESFLGTDLTYQDFERHRAEDYVVQSVARGDLLGEPAQRLISRPVAAQQWDRVDFLIADSDLALLEISYYKTGGVLTREVSAPRAFIERHGRNLIPTRLHIVNRTRGTSTFVDVLALAVDPEIDQRIFSVSTLDSGRRLTPTEVFESHGRERSPAD